MSNITRPVSVVRRRPHLLDMLVPKDLTVQGYRLQASTTFSGGFTTILTADISSGYLDPAVDRRVLQALNNPNHIRIVFDPQTFNGVASIEDDKQFWLKYVPVDFSGTPGTASNPMLVIPEEKLRGDSVVAISGSAPSGATVANSLPLLLPFRAQDITIRNNDGANSLYVALEAGGSEVQLGGGATTLSQVDLPVGAQGCILVRGGGAAVNFSAVFTSFLPL